MVAITLKEMPKYHYGNKPDFELFLNGNKIGNVYFNMRGYVVNPGLPLPCGSFLQLPECGISAIKKEIAAINKEFKTAK